MLKPDELQIDESIKDLQKSKLFHDLDVRDFSKFVKHINFRIYQAGETIFKSNAPAKNVYYVYSGSVNIAIENKVIDEVSGNCIGEEAAIDVAHYLSNAVANSVALVLEIPQEAIRKVFQTNPKKQTEFYSLFIYRSMGVRITKPSIARTTSTKPSLQFNQPLGWISAIIVPLLVFYTTHQAGFEWNSYIFLMILSATIVMWIFSLVPEFIPAIFAILSLLILGVAPSSVILSGFASGSFFMAMSLFGLGAIIADSGITYRAVLLASRFLPFSQFWYSLSLLVNGILLTPVLPSANGRIKLIGILLIELLDSVGIRSKGKLATNLAVSTFMGVSLFSSVFLSSKSANFVVYGLLPPQVQQQFSWGYWLTATTVMGLVTIAGYLLVSSLVFRTDESLNVSQERVDLQLKVLGTMTNMEWLALGSVFLFLIGITTASIHKIDLPWIALGVFFLFLSLGLMGKKDFQTKIDWSFLILLGSLVGLAKTMSYIELDRMIGSNLEWLGYFMGNDFGLFVIIFLATILFIRLLLPNNATVAIFATILIPMAETNGINPWLVGILLLSFSDIWLLPYQCSYYLLFREIMSESNMFNERLMLRTNILTIGIRLAAIYISFPYWEKLGLM
ncbi:anion permease [Pleurocapsales cyanobacterium LEGE 10410]|nr:anion permease [Pleurocapsales cyanobacterium LEGE 10410]